nr:outer membrane beta-barrel protein [Pedobacter panaciterrae]
MKKKLLTAVAVLATLCGYAQTKGTSTLGLGVSVTTSKIEFPNQTSADSKTKSSSFSLGYGLFVKDNTRIGLELQYGEGTGNGSGNDSKSYGGNVTYQQYYPLIGKLYAYAGGKGAYGYTKSKLNDPDSYNSETKSNTYSLGAYGGLTWFVSKRFAFETTLLSANASYGNYKQKVNNATYADLKQTNFNLTTQGFINDLGFKIYLLF